MNWDKLNDKMKARLQREHPEQFGPNGIRTGWTPAMCKSLIRNAINQPEAPKPSRQILSAEDKLNKTEKMLLVLLRARYGEKAVRIQAIRLELAPNCTYTPDFSVTHGRTKFYECKGAFVRDDAIVKLKTAARLYPEYDFWLCQWRNNCWTETLLAK